MKPTQLYSINALSIELGRDRAAVTRAMRDIPPDGEDRGQPRWKMATAVAALQRRQYRGGRPGSNRAIDKYDFGRPTKIDALRHDYEQGLFEIMEAKSPKEKEKLALKLAPLLDRYGVVYREIGKAINAGDDIQISARSELIFSEMMDEVRKTAEWSGEDFGLSMLEAMPFGDEDEMEPTNG